MHRFHIREAVVFEDILSEEDTRASGALQVSRTRMSLQQLLDDPSNSDQLLQKCFDYSQEFDHMVEFVTTHRHLLLQKQPTFHWYVDNQSISSSCWLLDSIIVKHICASLLECQGTTLLSTDVKQASQHFKQAIDVRETLLEVLQRWKWKSLQHPILETGWHQARQHYATAQQQMAMIEMGLSNGVQATTLFTVSQRAIRSAVLSLAAWASPEAVELLHSSEALRYLFSSNVLWSQGKYGEAIYRLQHWLSNSTHTHTGPFPHIQTQFDGLPLLLASRLRDNETIYFQQLSPAPPLTEACQLSLGHNSAPHPPFEEREASRETRETRPSGAVPAV
jgi:hypothetical protein